MGKVDAETIDIKGMGDEALQKYLLFKGNVMTLARTYFGKKNAGEKDEYIRLSYATSKDNIKKGMERIRKALADKKMIAEFLKEEKK